MSYELDRQIILNLRQYYLGIVNEYEKMLGEQLTTSQMRKWFKNFGPTAEEARAQLEKGKQQLERSATDDSD